MNELKLHPNMLLGVTVPAFGAGEPAERACRREEPLLRRLGVKSCVVECAWDEIEPEAGAFSAAALHALHEQLVALRTLEIEPLLCLWHGREPGWFRRVGGWDKDESVLRFVRYAQRVVESVGHLAAEYITFAEPNALLLDKPRRGAARLSAAAIAHLRCWRLIHDMRRARGLRDTAVGFALHMRPVAAAPGRFRFALPRPQDSTLLYQQLPLRAFARGEFILPMKNPGTLPPGLYCDFLGFTYGVQAELLPQPRRWRRGSRDDLGREIWPEGLEDCCAALLKTAARPLYFLDRGACDWDDSFRARYIYEHLRTVCASHQPVLRYYYQGLLDGREQAEGLSARRGLFRSDGEGGCVLKESGEFYAQLIRDGGVSQELYQRYVAGQEYRH